MKHVAFALVVLGMMIMALLQTVGTPQGIMTVEATVSVKEKDPPAMGMTTMAAGTDISTFAIISP